MNLLWYVKTPLTELVYDDIELVPLPKVARDARAVKLEAVKQAETVKPVLDPKAKPVEVVLAEADLKAALVDELALHRVLRGYDDQEMKALEIDAAGATVAARWDGVSPYVTMVVGVFPVLVETVDKVGNAAVSGGIPFMGWPQTDVPPPVVDHLPEIKIVEAEPDGPVLEGFTA